MCESSLINNQKSRNVYELTRIDGIWMIYTRWACNICVCTVNIALEIMCVCIGNIFSIVAGAAAAAAVFAVIIFIRIAVVTIAFCLVNNCESFLIMRLTSILIESSKLISFAHSPILLVSFTLQLSSFLPLSHFVFLFSFCFFFFLLVTHLRSFNASYRKKAPFQHQLHS